MSMSFVSGRVFFRYGDFNSSWQTRTMPFVESRMSNALNRAAAELSRRSILRNIAVAAGGAAVLAATASGTRLAEAQTKATQKAVGYQDTPKGAQRCDNCRQFEPPDSCKTVEGTISPAGWCKVYVKKPA